LLPVEAEQVKEQIADTEALIEREIQEFNERHKTELRPEERPKEDERRDSARETEGEHHTESSPVLPVAESDSTNSLPLVQENVRESGNDHVTVERDPLEENGEVVVEGDEDTVIY
jgi:hypothetical protein